MSILGWIVITILCIGEIRNYLNPPIKEHMRVDTTFGQQLQVNIDISFHALTCTQVHVDAMDIAGLSVSLTTLNSFEYKILMCYLFI